MPKNYKFIFEEVITKKSLEVHFQPIVSIVKKSVIGLEGLVRGHAESENSLIDPITLFKIAAKEKQSVNLDRICSEKVMNDYVEIFSKHKDVLLFLNIDGSMMTEETGPSPYLVNLVNRFNLKPENIVLEIVESKVSSEQALNKFVNEHRNFGFLIAIDNVGSGRSNLDRIIVSEPDIIKIDRVIVKDMHLDYYKQEVFKSLVGLSKTLGALVIAEGIETEGEAMKAIELGADMLQGFYFASPQRISSNMLKSFNLPVRKVAANYYAYLLEKINLQKSKYKEYDNIIKEAISGLSAVEEKRFDYTLLEIINKYRIFECVYILDPSGIQVTDTVANYSGLSKHKNLIFKPAQKGDDHSLKKYYYFLKNMKLSKYLTEPYISLATGNVCVTLSNVFKNMEGRRFILCVDLNPDYLNI
jgi:EAL domain-containing protein (putative c-di-GMP-specific phosphodiesterase class I)